MHMTELCYGVRLLCGMNLGERQRQTDEGQRERVSE